jgi:ubiquitin C-terminal hydrolase
MTGCCLYKLAHNLSPDRVQFYMDSPSQATPPSQMPPDTPKKDPSLKGVVGIQNMGNTCYSNSTLQLLRASPEWNAFCLTQNFVERLEHLPEENTYKRVLLAYQDILKSLWSAHKPAYVRPLGFISEVRKAVQGTVYEMFGIPIPNDSHEYLVYLLDSFHEAMKTQEPSYVEKPIQEDATKHEKMIIMAENGWNRFVSKQSSEVVHLFFGMIRKTIQCTNCQNNSYQWEVFNSLKIPCEGETFHDWIRNEVKESEIEDYQCEKCKGRHLAKIASHLWKLPHSLFVTLRRFHFNGSKNMTNCPYQGENLSFSEFFADESNDPSRYWSYELRGVSDHHGTHMGGHYTAQFKHPITGEWWWMDDENAKKLEQAEFSSSNYIFFFRKN